MTERVPIGRIGTLFIGVRTIVHVRRIPTAQESDFPQRVLQVLQ
ncbi:hypothetical protein ALPO108162_16960 [Alicyclobacillus pomorum]